MENPANVSSLVSNSGGPVQLLLLSLQIMAVNVPNMGRDLYIQVEANIGHIKIPMQTNVFQDTF